MKHGCMAFRITTNGVHGFMNAKSLKKLKASGTFNA